MSRHRWELRHRTIKNAIYNFYYMLFTWYTNGIGHYSDPFKYKKKNKKIQGVNFMDDK